MFRKIISVPILILIGVTAAFAEKTYTVKAAYTYYASPNESVEDAKRKALDFAKIEAIASKFGAVVTQQTSSQKSSENGKFKSRFHSTGGTEILGEWIETITAPEYDIQYIDNILVVSVNLKGKIREIRRNGIDFVAKSLRNGTELKFEDNEFSNGDDLFLYFRTPVKGYIAAFLLDEAAGQCFCLLPYKNQDGRPVAVDKDTDYIFFSEAVADEQTKELVDEYTLTAEHGIEYNTLYVVFSPNEFARPTTKGNASELIPVSSPINEFLEWVSKQRSRNKEFNCITIPLSISPQKN